MMEMIPAEALQARRLYVVHARHLWAGVWDARSSSFIGLRTKFRQRMLDSEPHWGQGGIAWAVDDTGRDVPADIPLDATDPTICLRCSAHIHWVGQSPWGVDEWRHREPSQVCSAAVPRFRVNARLQAWLIKQEAAIDPARLRPLVPQET